MNRLVLLCIPLACMCAAPAALCAQIPDCVRFEPDSVALDGVLHHTMRYGPPNFGETPRVDQPIRVPILRLNHAIAVCGDPTSDVNRDTVRAITQIQLIFPHQSALPWYGKHIRVRGTLMLGHTGNHFTRVVMVVHGTPIATRDPKRRSRRGQVHRIAARIERRRTSHGRARS